MPYVVCFYKAGKLVHEVEADPRDAAELAALDGFRADALCEVTIYTPAGKALKGWFRRSSL